MLPTRAVIACPDGKLNFIRACGRIIPSVTPISVFHPVVNKLSETTTSP